MAKSESHKRAQSKAAGKSGKTEVPISRHRRVDAKTEARATEVERSGDPKLLREAAQRLRDAGTAQRVLQVPQKDMAEAAEAMKAAKVKGSVKNMSGSKRRSV